MLNAFELRITDVLADALAGFDAIEVVTRPRTGVTPPVNASKAVVAVRVLSASPNPRWGDDARERRGRPGSYELKTMLHLHGQAAVDASIHPGTGNENPSRRQVLVQVMDRILTTFHTERLRDGRAFLNDADQGFELDQFRFAGMAEPAGASGFAAFRALFDFAGRFWPVEPAAEGDHILTLPTRVTVLPMQFPDRPRVRAGGPNLAAPVRLDLRAFNGAPTLLAARLTGSAPQGSLIGAGGGVPPGWTAFPIADGVARIVYQPPTTVPGPMQVRVATAIGQPDGPVLPLTEFEIELTP